MSARCVSMRPGRFITRQSSSQISGDMRATMSGGAPVV
jgi:hypothetical protein